jgi:hypothetical protein
MYCMPSQVLTRIKFLPLFHSKHSIWISRMIVWCSIQRTLGHLSFLTNEDELHTDYKSAVIAFGMVKVLEAIRDCIPPVSWCNHSLQSCKKCDLLVINYLMMERLDLVGLIIGNQATRTHTVPRKSNQTFVALLFRLSFIVNAFHSHACVFISFSSFPCLALPCLAFLCYDTIDAIRES